MNAVETKSIAKAVAPLGPAMKAPGKLMDVLPSEIAPSKTNPRKNFDTPDWPDFVANVKAQGIVQPPVVRLAPKGVKENYELVCGERRWRAARELKLPMISVVLQQLTDEQAVEIQQVENLQREDLSPLEEARGYGEWLEKLLKDLLNPSGQFDSKDKAIEYIAARVGRKRSTIYAKLSVLKTNKTVQEALQSGEIDISKAGLLAQIPDAKRQTEALKKFIRGEWNSGPMSFRQAKAYVEQQHRKNLSGATWKLDDAELVRSAGPCTTCPYRTGNIPEADGDPNICTSPDCFESKRQAVMEKKKKEYAAKGMTVLSEAEGQKIMPYDNDSYLAYGCGYTKLSSVCDRDPKRRTYEQILGKDAPAAVYAPHDGKLVQVHKLSDLSAALKKKGVKFEARSSNNGEDEKTAKVRKEREKLGGVLQQKVFEKLAQLPSDPKTEKKFWALVVADYCESYYGNANIEEIIGIKGSLPGDAEKLAKFPLEQLRAAAAAFVLHQQAIVEHYSGDWSPMFEQLCELAGVDLKKEEKAAALAEAKPNPKPEQLKLSRKAAKSKK